MAAAKVLGLTESSVRSWAGMALPSRSRGVDAQPDIAATVAVVASTLKRQAVLLGAARAGPDRVLGEGVEGSRRSRWYVR